MHTAVNLYNTTGDDTLNVLFQIVHIILKSKTVQYNIIHFMISGTHNHINIVDNTYYIYNIYMINI